MKIHGVDGMSPEYIRDEINRGGRMVIYTYCVSVVLMTFKRPSDIRLVKAAQSPAAAGWPYILASFLFGWWGIPWGPIYTVQSIYQNLCGGIDVTDAVLHDMFPTGSASHAPAAATSATPATSGGFNARVAMMMLVAVCVAGLIGISAYCYHKTQNLTVVLTSGLGEPYTVVLNGEEHSLAPWESKVLTLAEGEFTLTDAAGSEVVGGERTFNFSLPFFDHLGSENVAIINPDRVAVLIDGEVPYYKDDTAPPQDETPGFRILVSQLTYFLPKPDFVIEPAAESISLPSGTTRLVKRRLYNVPDPGLPQIIETISEKLGYPAVREFLTLLAKHRSDEDFLGPATMALEAEDLRAFFQINLGVRPVPVEWHRYYQGNMAMHFPDHDLVGEYRTYLQAEPDNGALCYLLARQVADRAEQDGLWKRALAADPPCHYAYNAIGYNAATTGRFEEALAHYDESLKAGIASKALTRNRRELLMALGKTSELLAEISEERKSRPFELALVEEEMIAAYAATNDPAEAAGRKDAYMAACKSSNLPPEFLDDSEAFLGAALAQLTGDMETYARQLSRFKYPFYQFRASIAAGDADGAAVLAAQDLRGDSSAHLLLYLLALRRGDEQGAEHHFAAAHTAMRAGSPDSRMVATLLEDARPDASAICDSHIEIESKRILLTAMGVRYSADREVYFAMARKLNFNPQFPQHLLTSFLKA
ncbi:MAG TPA: hypothetical protein VMM36_18340 [Opitutaceae bacterium]|nr:hypothetical protein [Opitutaceae bacterium]